MPDGQNTKIRCKKAGYIWGLTCCLFEFSSHILKTVGLIQGYRFLPWIVFDRTTCWFTLYSRPLWSIITWILPLHIFFLYRDVHTSRWLDLVAYVVIAFLPGEKDVATMYWTAGNVKGILCVTWSDKNTIIYKKLADHTTVGAVFLFFNLRYFQCSYSEVNIAEFSGAP